MPQLTCPYQQLAYEGIGCYHLNKPGRDCSGVSTCKYKHIKPKENETSSINRNKHSKRIPLH